MSIIDIVEGSSFLRPINYLRVRNDYSFKYNWLYPIILCAVLFSGVYLGVATHNPADLLSAINKYGSLLTVLFPFYFASLAATSSLGGVPALDKKFEMANEVTLKIKLADGEYETLDLCPRDFISLLFAYCTTVSLFLLVVSYTTSGLIAVVEKLPVCASWAAFIVLFFITFLLSQLLVTTLLGVYFLSDYMVRQRASSDSARSDEDQI
ncbi:hypothetical protein Q4560_03825 [Celeribacter halophilus]|uniref:hypothetical protein n=1 Tax=Celeribacter halophilus TaxID=576117 RepID=UPI0026E373BA|nr:hypothetical protein [Celeribacter halophilus]MDO6722386.1 hypothetical protein [Celeribacter halophilus]